MLNNTTFLWGNDSLYWELYSRGEAIGFIFINSVFGLAGVVGNLLVIVAFSITPKLRTKTNFFLLSMAVVGLFLSLVCIPMWNIFLMALAGEHEYLSAIFFVLLFTLEPFCCITLIVTLLGISAVRLFAVLQPFRFDHMPRKGFAIAAFVVPWCTGVVIVAASIVIMFFAFTVKFFAAFVILVYFVPLIVIIVIYIIIIRKSLLAARTGQQSAVENHRAVLMLFIVVACFITTFSPYFIVILTAVHCETCEFHGITPFAVARVFLFSNSFINPIIYTCRSRDFNEAFKRILYGLLPFSKPVEHVIIEDKQMEDITVNLDEKL